MPKIKPGRVRKKISPSRIGVVGCIIDDPAVRIFVLEDHINVEKSRIRAELCEPPRTNAIEREYSHNL